MTEIPAFGEILRFGSRGTQPVAVKRGLYRAGYKTGWTSLDGTSVSARIFGAFAVRNLVKFQKDHGLKDDGVYGPATHKKVAPFFDDYARLLYEPAAIQLPKSFEPTHQTAGLPGFPAIDIFGKAGTAVLAPEAGTITRLSGKDPAQGGVPGGAYGWSMYLTVPHAQYFLTHFATRTVVEGQKVEARQRLGTICDAKVAGMPSSLSHIHEGKHTE